MHLADIAERFRSFANQLENGEEIAIESSILIHTEDSLMLLGDPGQLEGFR